MTWHLFRCRRDPAREKRARETERQIEQERGEQRNRVQTIQSHSRRLNLMAGALALKEQYDGESR